MEDAVALHNIPSCKLCCHRNPGRVVALCQQRLCCIGLGIVGSYLNGDTDSNEVLAEMLELGKKLSVKPGDILTISRTLFKAGITSQKEAHEKFFGKDKPVQIGIPEEAIHGEVLDSAWNRWFREDSTGDNATVGEADRYAPFVHGATVVCGEFEPGKDGGKNLLGPGVYLLNEDDLALAEAYAGRALDRVLE